MSGGMLGAPMTPRTIGDYINALERRLNESDTRERGAGRRAWSDGAQVLIAGAAELDGGHVAWRKLNDGRIELRGRLLLTDPLANQTRVLRLPGMCAPLGNGTTRRAWVSAVAPCSSSGSNLGLVRVDIERAVEVEPYVDAEEDKTQHVIYADVIAYPPQDSPLTGWIGFDHVIYDPDLYLDALEPLPAADFALAFSRGVEVEPNKWAIRDSIPGEFGIAILNGEQGYSVVTIPGLRGPDQPTPL